MDMYEDLARQCGATVGAIKSYREMMRGAMWSPAEKLALAALLASHGIAQGDVESFVAAYGNLDYTQITEQEQQPGQGVSEVNREILELIIEKHDELEALLKHYDQLLEPE